MCDRVNDHLTLNTKKNNSTFSCRVFLFLNKSYFNFLSALVTEYKIYEIQIYGIAK